MRRTLPPLLFVAGVVAGFFVSRHFAAKEPVPGTVTVKVDTLYFHDTILVEKPKIVEKRVVDTMTVEVPDYIVVHDTAYVNLPREEVVYRDSSYRAVVSGFLPRLEEIEIYRQDRIVTIETEKVVKARSRWAVGAQAGYGITPAGFQPYLGVGVSFNLLYW